MKREAVDEAVAAAVSVEESRILTSLEMGARFSLEKAMASTRSQCRAQAVAQPEDLPRRLVVEVSLQAAVKADAGASASSPK